jgi:hypothetical protein
MTATTVKTPVVRSNRPSVDRRSAQQAAARELDRYRRGLDFSRLPGLVACSEVGPQMIVKTKEGREIRITVLRDMSTGRYLSAYERLSPLTSSGVNDYPVWTKTPAYRSCTATDLDDCLDAALREVSAVRLY